MDLVFLGMKRDSNEGGKSLKIEKRRMKLAASGLHAKSGMSIQCSPVSRIREIISLRTGQFCSFRSIEWRRQMIPLQL